MGPKNNQICMLVCFVFIALFSGCVAQVYDYFKLVQQWPPAFCKINTCDRTVDPMNFTIHGLWPDKNTGQFVEFCRRITGAPDFVSIDERRLVRRLDASWPDLLNPITYGTNEQTFWKKQWDKHGTCSWNFFRQQNLYFEKALFLKNKFDLLKILHQNQIDPGTEVDVSRVTQIITRATGGVPIVKCTFYQDPQARWKKVYQLTEIVICFDRNAVSVIPCPLNKKINTNFNYGCPTKARVDFPK